MLNWTDVTLYSRGDMKRNPSVLECKLSQNIRMRVHKHIHYGEIWLLSSEAVGLDKITLGTEDIEKAKKIAFSFMKKRLMQKQEELQTAITALKSETV